MKVFCVLWFLLIFAGVGGDMLHFRKTLLDTFNNARAIIASGKLGPLVDLVNWSIGWTEVKLPKFGPAENMYKLRWSRHLEQHAYLYTEKHGFKFENVFSQFKQDGLVGFTWTGMILKFAEKVINYIPIPLLKEILGAIVELLDLLLTCLLLLHAYPGEAHITENSDIAASNALFAHRYEIGCYGKMLYTVCMMEGSINGGQFYIPGVPCKNCNCTFHEDENGYIEEDDLCEPPKESTAELYATFSPPLTTTLPMRTIVANRNNFWPTKPYISMPSIMFSLVVLIAIMLAHIFSK